MHTPTEREDDKVSKKEKYNSGFGHSSNSNPVHNDNDYSLFNKLLLSAVQLQTGRRL